MKQVAEKAEVGEKAYTALKAALAFLVKDGGELQERAKPVIKGVREAMAELETGIITVAQPPKDTADISYDGTNPENPRLTCNIPGGAAYWNLLPAEKDAPAYVVVLARADQQEKALGCLAAATHAVNVFKDVQEIQKMRLTHGVKDFLGGAKA